MHPQQLKRKKSKKDPNFIGYTFKKNEENQRLNLINALQELEAARKSGSVRKSSAPLKHFPNTSDLY